MQNSSVDNLLPLTRFIRLCTCIEIVDSTIGELKKSAQGIDDWSALASVAERHGLAPLIYSHIKTHDLPVPPLHVAARDARDVDSHLSPGRDLCFIYANQPFAFREFEKLGALGRCGIEEGVDVG